MLSRVLLTLLKHSVPRGAINIPQMTEAASVEMDAGGETYCTKRLVWWLFFKGRMFSINYLLYTQTLSPITLPSQRQ